MHCVINSPWFKRMFKGNNYQEFMRGFGENEQERGSAEEDRVLDDASFKKELARDLMLAVDRDNNNKLSFSEYMLLRKSVISWM